MREAESLSDNASVIEKPTIEITVNGEAYQLAGDSTVVDLVDALKLASERLAIELNLSILPRAAWSETKLKDGDRIEIVHFVGGGWYLLLLSRWGGAGICSLLNLGNNSSHVAR